MMSETEERWWLAIVAVLGLSGPLASLALLMIKLLGLVAISWLGVLAPAIGTLALLGALALTIIVILYFSPPEEDS